MRIFLCFILTFLLSGVSSYGQRGDWYNDEGGFEFQGSGTKGDPYLISSVTALTFFAEQINIWPGKSFQGEYFLLTDDIDLGKHFWIPVGSEGHQPFRGIFDGNGKSIRNVYIGSVETDNVFTAAGFFGHLGNGAKIENLTIDGGSIIGGGREILSRTGGLAGYLLCSVSEGEDSIVIRNCHVRNMRVIGADTEIANTGGLAGEGYSFADGEGRALILIENCSYDGDVMAKTSNFPCVGGLVGKGRGHGYCDGALPASGSFLLRSCRNSGEVTGGNTTGKDAISSTGGIIGFGYAAGDNYGTGNGTGLFVVEYCLNRGIVSGGEANSLHAFSYTGGLSGYGDGYGYGDSSPEASSKGYGRGAFVVRSSANRGEVRGGNVSDTTAISSTGGLVGYASGSSFADGSGRTNAYGSFFLRNCYSYASLTACRGFLGGLSGWLATTGEGKSHSVASAIQNSYVAGNIRQGDSIPSLVVGGITGRMEKSKETGKAPQVGGCLVALLRLDGQVARTFRIVGDMQGILQPYTNVLGRNYAYVKEGNWMKVRSIRNGNDWSRSMLRLPVSSWNADEYVWLVKEDGYARMPVLNHLPGQGEMPTP
ncbi:MAG: hypothetical protein LBS05_01525 [Tannerellaceae bacterium]|nr:hypothetical protein [Tannerellaceae bacterium]